MCYSPAVRSTDFIESAIQRINEGKTTEAKRLLIAVKQQMTVKVGNIEIDGVKVKDRFKGAIDALKKAEALDAASSQPKPEPKEQEQKPATATEYTELSPAEMSSLF